MIEQFSPDDWIEYCDVVFGRAMRMIDSGVPKEIAVGELALIGFGYALEAVTEGIETTT